MEESAAPWPSTRTLRPASFAGTFGFDPDESAAHFLAHIPAGAKLPVHISEHLSWNTEHVAASVHLSLEREDGQVRCRLYPPDTPSLGFGRCRCAGLHAAPVMRRAESRIRVRIG
ncbi:MAG: hypothetical protein ACREXK_09770 [Gammaproteobacteria bacterium]